MLIPGCRLLAWSSSARYCGRLREALVGKWKGAALRAELIIDTTGFLDVGGYKGYIYTNQRSRSHPRLHRRSTIVASIHLKCPNDKRSCGVARFLDDGRWRIRYESR